MTEEQKKLESILLRLVEDLYIRGSVDQLSLIAHELIELWKETRNNGISETDNENQ
jgi:hypothetical protein|nr:MAG TPA: hypothetical protein [Caudoviricetes sp.]